jgi:hypothetical protein
VRCRAANDEGRTPVGEDEVRSEKFKMLEEQQETKALFERLKSEMGRIGKELVELGTVLKHPDEYIFNVGSLNIFVGHHERVIAHCSQQSLDLENVLSLISEYQDAKVRLADVSARADNLGG